MEEEDVITIEGLTNLSAACNSELEDKYNTVESFIERLNKGVSPLSAAKIIDEIWGNTSRAKSIKLKLSGFENNNGYAILSSELSRSNVGALYQEQIFSDYFVKISGLIEILVDDVLAAIKTANFTEEDQTRYNEIRKNVLNYIDLLRSGWHHEEVVKHADTFLGAWEDISYESDRSCGGDYLFFDSFKEELVNSHKYFLENEICLQDQNGGFYSFYNLKYHLKRLKPSLTIPFLFAGYLQRVLDDLN